MGSVQEVRPGVYRVRVYVGKIDGREKVIARTFDAPNRRAAIKLSKGYEADILAVRDQMLSTKGTVTELVDRWVKHQASHGRAETSKYREQSIVKRIKQRLGHIPLNQLTVVDVDEFYGWLHTYTQPSRRKPRPNDTRPPEPVRKLSASTIHHHHRILSSILYQGETWGMIDKVPTRKATKPKRPKKAVKVVDNDVLAALFATAPRSIKVAVSVDVMLGLRRGELFGLRWADMHKGVAHIANNTVQVPGMPLIDKGTKSGRERDVPMITMVQEILVILRLEQEAAAKARGTQLAADARVMADMIADPAGRTPLKPGWLSLAWRRHCDAVGHRVRLHDLRHWFASWLIAQGVGGPVVQMIVGHELLSTTLDVYVHAQTDAHDVVRKALDAAVPALFALNPGTPVPPP